MNGARELYKAVVLLPFIDASKLRAAAREPLSKLLPEESGRNRFGELPHPFRLQPSYATLPHIATQTRIPTIALTLTLIANPILTSFLSPTPTLAFTLTHPNPSLYFSRYVLLT